MVDPYAVLGVKTGADQAQIRKAYRRLARRHHPDAQPGADGSATELALRRMALLNAAWEVLGDPDRRAAYDAGSVARAAGTDSPAPSHDRAAAGRSGVLEDTPYDGLGEDEIADLHRRPADSMVMVPVLVVIAAVALFALGVVTGSKLLWTVSLLMLPLAGVGFVMAPLTVMVRNRRR